MFLFFHGSQCRHPLMEIARVKVHTNMVVETLRIVFLIVRYLQSFPNACVHDCMSLHTCISNFKLQKVHLYIHLNPIVQGESEKLLCACIYLVHIMLDCQ